ncbi:AAA family ATPase [Solirubrobacter sp. CPCC 204708]|uniref:AAA family ATPase n=1 Tax=Solirubrobacter deserti TaxID=2282478 RepID=A0ABT4RPY8_9ACTN|nr:AAA family ATPase [Solirubrobacter deserti]MBE2318293.1 AAA family ATPase [Solirubrobacter deserti]MDA0140632.1 AAA family ATPase [Solirubrobacter deserti]
MVEGWDIRLCGPVLVEANGRRLDAGLPGRQGRLLFAYLVLNRSRGCPRDELIDALWPEGPPAAADSALSALLSKLRRALGEGVLTGRGELRLRLEGSVSVDIESSRIAIAEAEAAMEAGDHALAAVRARDALLTDLQTFLPDAEGGWAAEQRRELETLRLRGLETLAEAGLRAGGRELGSAEQAARAAIAAAPFRESAHRLLMEVHEAAGNPAEALRAFEELRSLLREELGTTPGPAAMTVFERVLRGEPPPTYRGPAPVVASPVALEPAPWPAPLAAAVDRHALIGRRVELAFLERCWREGADGQRALVLLAGDAGIGKTRLAAELARTAHEDGAAVLYGRFDEETLTPYQPVVEMLRGWSAGAPLDALRDRLGPRAAELAILLPEFGPPPADHVGGSGVSGAEADAQRFRFFDAVAALLGEIGSEAPVVLVFDDLQWADRPTLQLLRHLVRSPAPRRVLFLGTYRESEISDRHPLHELIGDLRREGTLRRLELGGLAELEVGELVAELAHAPASESFVHALAGETEGNPFFIEEVVRHVRETAGALSEEVTLEEAGVPDGVREVTSRRLRRLSEPTHAVLLVASVIGREFDYDVLATVVDRPDDDLVEALEEAVEARVLREIGHVGRYGFTHGLVRATLYDSISQLRRARLHGRVGETLVSLRGGDLDPHLAMLAHHFAQAAPVERPDRAIDFALAAARRADRLLAWEEAAQHYRAALRARELSGAVDDHVRAELLLALGASEERAGMESEARESFAAAIRVARGLHDPVLLTRGVLGQAGPWSALSRSDPERVALLDEAMTELPEDDSPLRARLLARMSLELYYAGEPELRLSLSDEALRIARRLGDPRTLAACLDARHYALWRPENTEERLAVAAELRGVAEQTGDPELELQGAAWTIIDLMELGDIDGVDIQIAAVSKLADALHRPIWLWWAGLFRATRALLDGRFDEAEQLAQETLAIGQRGQAENALHYYAQCMYSVRREQGRLAEVEGAVRNFIELYPAIPAWRSALALLLIELGRPDEARAEFEVMAASGFDIPRDANWLVAVTVLAEVCGALGDAARAGQLYAMLEPYAGRNVVVGRNATFNGSASWLLGLLAAAQGRYELAESHFAAAQEMHVAMGARPFQARTQVAWAEMLLAQGDVERASEMLADAILVADALGMVVLAERARSLVPAAKPA